jgi:predicted nucleic acid-binding protein
MPGSFFDSNVALYLLSSDAVKADRAEALLRDGGTISVQVLNEIANVGRRKLGLTWPQVVTFLAELRLLVSVVPLTVETHEGGLWLSERYRLSFYDASIVSAALIAGCDTLWSEDMQHGLSIDGRLTVRNPFA